MYRNDVDAMVAQIDALRRDLAAADSDRERAARLERELSDRTRELERLRRRLGELPPRPVSRGLLGAALLVTVVSATASLWVERAPSRAPVGPSPARAWFEAVRSHCNPVEVATALRRQPPPASGDGPAYGAACWALAGRIDAARTIIDGLGAAARPHAAGVVFGVAHPVADAGDDQAAGPIMELVLEYWPENYQALYHAGMAAFATGQPERARARLTAFRGLYTVDDGFTRNAREVLRRLDGGSGERPLERE